MKQYVADIELEYITGLTDAYNGFRPRHTNEAYRAGYDVGVAERKEIEHDPALKALLEEG